MTGGDGGAPGGFADDVELASAAFGQGETFVTPLQMALVASTVANDGVLMAPRLVNEITGAGPGATTVDPEVWRRVLGGADAQAIQEAMQAGRRGRARRAVHRRGEGPGRPDGRQVRARPSSAARASRTRGSSGSRPVDNPQVAIAVLVERGGRGGERAAPLAGDLLAEYFELYGRP